MPDPARTADPAVPPRPERLDDLPPRALVTLGAVVVAALLAAVSRTGDPRPWAALVVLGCGLVVANGWTRVLDLPSRKGTALVAVLGAVATTVSVLAPAHGEPLLRWLPAALAVSVVGAFAHQLLRTDGRPRVVASLSGSLLALGLLASGACWIAAAAEPSGRDTVLVGAVALALAAAVEALAQKAGAAAAIGPLAVLVGAAAAAALAPVLGLSWAVGLLLGTVASAVSVAVRAMLAPLPTLVARRAQLVSACASVLAAGVVVHLATWGLLG